MKTAGEVVKKEIEGNPDAGREAAGGIGDVSVGAIAGGIAACVGLGLWEGAAAGWVAGKFGEWLGKAIWDKQTQINNPWVPY